MKKLIHQISNSYNNKKTLKDVGGMVGEKLEIPQVTNSTLPSSDSSSSSICVIY
jgi:hypothetical protein